MNTEQKCPHDFYNHLLEQCDYTLYLLHCTERTVGSINNACHREDLCASTVKGTTLTIGLELQENWTSGAVFPSEQWVNWIFQYWWNFLSIAVIFSSGVTKVGVTRGDNWWCYPFFLKKLMTFLVITPQHLMSIFSHRPATGDHLQCSFPVGTPGNGVPILILAVGTPSASLSVLAALCKLKFGGPCRWPRSNQCQLKHITSNTWRVKTEVRTHKLTQVTWYITKYSCTNEITHSEFMHPALAENK